MNGWMDGMDAWMNGWNGCMDGMDGMDRWEWGDGWDG